MRTLFFSLFSALLSCLRSRASLQVENLALRHQINVLQRSDRRRLRLSLGDRFLWVWLSRLWRSWRSALVIVKPETVIRWHRKGFRLYWTWKSRHTRPGRPEISLEVRDLIGKISLANPLWGASRIHGELLKLGIELSQATVAKYMVRESNQPTPANSMKSIARAQTVFGLVCSLLAAVLGQNSDSYRVNVIREAGCHE
jgi:hypothetical protein